MQAVDTVPAPRPAPPPVHCPAEAGVLLTCDEKAGHRNGGWHYDSAFDVTWREGCYLPDPDEG